MTYTQSERQIYIPTAPAKHPHLRQLPTHLQPSIHPSRNCHHTPTIPSSTHQQARYLNRSPTSHPSSSCQSHLHASALKLVYQSHLHASVIKISTTLHLAIVNAPTTPTPI